jgi:hypothetical protein
MEVWGGIFGCFGLVDLIWELEGFEGEEVR